MRKKPYSLNYPKIRDLMKGYYGSMIATSTNIKPEPGDTIINTAKAGDFAIGVLGEFVTEVGREDVVEIFGDQLDNSRRGLVVRWKHFPVKIAADFECVQGGYIKDDDLVHVYDDIVMSRQLFGSQL